MKTGSPVSILCAAVVLLFVVAPFSAGNADTMAGEERLTATDPVSKKTVAPMFPADAAEAGVGGSVTAEVLVGTDGRVSDVRILESTTGDMGFEQAAIEALEQWRFRPAREGKRKVDGHALVRLIFRPPDPALFTSGAYGRGEPVHSWLEAATTGLPMGIERCWTMQGPMPCKKMVSPAEYYGQPSRLARSPGRDSGPGIERPQTAGQGYKRPSATSLNVHVASSPAATGSQSRSSSTSSKSRSGTRERDKTQRAK